MQTKYNIFAVAMISAGLNFILTCTARTVDEQVALYAQGRKTVKEVNRLRQIAGLAPIKEAQNNVVTWTLNSQHIIDLDDGNPANDKSRAFDIVLVDPSGRCNWDVKADVNQDRISDYVNAGSIGERCGLRWGGRFMKPDYCHFEDIT